MPWPFSRKSAVLDKTEIEEFSSSASTRFAFKLFRELDRVGSTSNLFFSPSGVMLCLALVHELASGESRKVMAEVLEISGSTRTQLETEIIALKSAFSQRADATTTCANSLWLSKYVHLATAPQASLRALYDSEISVLDFESVDAIATINQWVGAKTQGKITRIVTELSPLSALVALNAVYFKAAWIDPFETFLTRDETFHLEDGSIKQLPIMKQSGTYRYHEDDQLQAICLPYRGGAAMYIILPAAKTNLPTFRQSLKSGWWESLLVSLKREEGVIRLPRFNVDYESQLAGVLSTLGMARAFDPHKAEFEHLHTDRPPVWIDRVVHRAVADVNEQGTEAAAATMTTVFCGSAMNQKPRRVFQMTVDRPFFVVIRDESTKVIQFTGWIADPR
jgi:serpin B